jgi:rSAM/selenodomain-associated transferase 1
LIDQDEGDLGARMERLFERAFELGEAWVILIGADTPHLPSARLAEARTALQEGADVVLGPAEDGGYYLIGLRQPAPTLLHDMEWSSPTVLQHTLTRAEAEGLRVNLLPIERDIDTPDDLSWLAAREGMEWVTQALSA